MDDDLRVTSKLDRKGRLHLTNVPKLVAAEIVSEVYSLVAIVRTIASIDETGSVLNTHLDLRITLLTELPAAQHAMEVTRLVAWANGVDQQRVVENPRAFA